MSVIPLKPSNEYPFSVIPAAASAEPTPTGGLVLVAKPNTDWWHTPEPDPADRRTGVLYGLPIDGTKDWQCGVWIKGEWAVQYDQGTLMVIAGDDGEDLNFDWLKTGIEMDGGKEWIGCVTASPWSDWSIAVAPYTTSTLNKDAYSVYLQITRTGATLTVRHAFALNPAPADVPPASELLMMREVKAFNVDAAGKPKTAPGGKWRIGPMTCGPQSQGTKTFYEGFTFKYL
ncbi:hypothetical protein CALCODRAFT_482407 [Calocera cornea HHB12733]|uniref:Uncharacterized protein n=1 Tax=Calocera cornea HHB12733 TaxID=1353952 RepID=A0A165GP41_9BASI|nr:hypothetical protein CALCODRAFT_482407 [Calocera cornea HHB12733]